MSFNHAHKRQLWNLPTTTTSSVAQHCTPFTLPSNGVISLADSAITLTTNVIFQPQCTGGWEQYHDNFASSVADLKDPFYASTTPQTYVIAAATVIAWILVFMLIITPRTSFFGSPSIQPGFSNGHGIIGGAHGSSSRLMGVGSRPWLQKAAALTVAVSLTIATADTFEVAEKQYLVGYMDANAMRDEVFGSLEIRITRVISDVFVWLAQVQTLVRLFPRHKEKVLIKWIGFALIICDSTFSCLNSFWVNSTNKPRHFVDAIPALSYLFELALGLLYAAWVIYYSLTKRRYAFYHHKMKSIVLIALLSLVAILTPVVFFVTDVSNADVAGWGDYFRWVGAAAASVVVWEWVERIEALERDEKKDGILGREIFDGDDMLDTTPSDEVVWSPGRRTRERLRRAGAGTDGDGPGGNATSALEHGFSSIAARLRGRQQPAPHHFPLGRAHSHLTETTAEHNNQTANGHNGMIAFGNLPKPDDRQRMEASGITPPPLVVSPVSRADTSSAASTVYVVRYEDGANVPQPIRRRVDPSGNSAEARAKAQQAAKDPEKEALEDEEPRPNRNRGQNLWQSVPNPFKRKRASPPAEVQKAREAADGPQRAATPAHNFSRWDVKNRLGVLAAETGERVRDRAAGRRQIPDFPVTVIPAQPRGSGRTWSPEIVRMPAPPQGPISGSSEESGGAHSGSTTLTANSVPEPTVSSAPQQVRSPGPSRANDNSPLGAGGADSPVIIPAPSRNSRPPRADDISPIADRSGGPIVVPAPSRNARPPRADDLSPVNVSNAPTVIPAPQRRSPLHIRTDAEGSNGSAPSSGSTAHENG